MMMRLAVFGAAVVFSHGKLAIRELGDKDTEPADSETIEGPDCGHVSQIIGKWGKAKKAGKLAGAARAAVMQADKADGAIDKVLTRAEGVGEHVGDGTVPSSVSGPVDYARKAMQKATDASVALEGKLDTFKQNVGETEFSAQKVSSDDMADLKKKTDSTNDAIKAAYEAADRATSKAKAAKEDALKDAGKALKLIKSVIKAGSPLVKDAKEIAQKSGFAIEDAATLRGKADDLISKVESKADKVEEQKPVFDALASNLKDKKSSVKDAADALQTAIDDMMGVPGGTGGIEGLAQQLKPLVEASEKGDGGDTNAVKNEAPSVPKAETAVDDTTAAISTVQGRGQTLMGRMERLKDLMKTANKKIA